MKKIIKVSLVAISILSISFTAVNEILDRLAIAESTAQRFILNNFIGSFGHQPVDIASTSGDPSSVYNQLKSFQIPKVSFATLASGKKAAAANELCAYVKNYASSKEFAAAYAKYRETAKPKSEPYSMDAATIEGMKKGVKQMEADLAKMKAQKLPAAAIQQMEGAIAQQKNQIAAQSDPTPNLTAWKKMYPKDPAIMIKNRLSEYLTLVKTVDYNAKLAQSGKYKKFTNPSYESKSLKWKAIYRAGPEVNKAVTSFVNEWLKEGIETDITTMGNSGNSGNKSIDTDEDENTNTSKSSDKQEENPKSLKSIKNKLKGKLKSVINDNL